MSTIKLKHLSVRKVFDANVFKDISSYDQLIDSIIEYGDAKRAEYEERVGDALEVFSEFFLTRYGTEANPRFGVLQANHTSQNKYQVGYDFSYRDFHGEVGHIQVKFRRNPSHKFTRSELGNFISMADEDGVPSSRRLLFTNQPHNITSNTTGIFDISYGGGVKQMRVIDRSYQEEFIDRDPTFWSDLMKSVMESGQEPKEFLPLRTFRPHQERMFNAATNNILKSNKNGRVICATGGGKTEVEFKLVRWMLLENNAQMCVVVAPTIDLLRQHHEYFEQFGLFHMDDIAVIHFRTGDEARTDDYISYVQTTKGDDFNREIQKNKKTVIFVTYASENHLFNIMREAQITVDLIVWDEFHHTISQKYEQLTHLQTLPTKFNLFFSASMKRGRVVCSFDEEVFGPLLDNVTYAELRKVGILVPRVIIKPLRVNTISSRLTGISNELKKLAKRDKFDLNTAIIESAALIVARENLIDNEGRANIVTFSKGVPICKAITSSPAVQLEVNSGLLQTVHAGIPARERKEIYNAVKTSTDSVLCQYSVVKEGIDITPFNGAIISREMDVTGTQQGIGRIVRAEPEDTANLKAGKISLESPTGWKKYTSTVYVIVHDETMENFDRFIRDLVVKLQMSGLEYDDYQMVDMIEERTGLIEQQTGDVPIVSMKDLFDEPTLREYIQALQAQMEEQENIEVLQNKVKDATSLQDEVALLV